MLFEFMFVQISTKLLCALLHMPPKMSDYFWVCMLEMFCWMFEMIHLGWQPEMSVCACTTHHTVCHQPSSCQSPLVHCAASANTDNEQTAQTCALQVVSMRFYLVRRVNEKNVLMTIILFISRQVLYVWVSRGRVKIALVKPRFNFQEHSLTSIYSKTSANVFTSGALALILSISTL